MEHLYPKSYINHAHPSWSIGSLMDDYLNWEDEQWPVSGDDIALYRAGVTRG